MSMWEFHRIGDYLTLRCNFTHFCEFHPQKPTPVKVYGINKFRFDIEDKEAYACDIITLCPYCGAVTYFGIAVSKLEYENIYGKDKKLDSAQIQRDVNRQLERQEDIEILT